MSGQNHLLVIGIDTYNSSSLQDLDNAKGDALRIKKILEDVYGFECIQDPIIDGAATRDTIINALYELHNFCLEEDNLIIFYAGHGLESTSGRGCWVPVDAANSRANQILDQDIVTRLENLKAKHVLIISDSCFSGRLFQKTRSPLTSTEYDEIESRFSRWVFASGPRGVKDGVPGEGSPFSNSIFRYLEDNKHRIFSAGELFQQVITEVKGLGKQIPEAKVIDMEEHDDGQMVFRPKTLLQETKDRGTYSKSVFQVPDIKSLQYYIPRTVSLYDPTDNEAFSFFKTQKERARLIDVIVAHKRAVLLGSAGSGKSVELNQLAKKLQSDKTSFVSIFKRFNTYVDQDIEDFLPKGWEKVNPSSLVLFLDGLDEIQQSHFNTALRKIGDFVEKFRTVSVIISCRSNFYELPKKSFGGSLSGFNIYNLNDITPVEIINYATDNFKLDGQAFFGAVEEAGLRELIQKPYFLDIIIRYYNDHHELKGRRSAIMEDALENYYWDNKEHFKTTGSLPPKDMAFDMLEKIAFVMEMMGTNIIGDRDLRTLFESTQDFNNCKFLPAFHRDNEKNGWMFEHNNIQEFLAARSLERQSFEQLTQIVSQNLSGEVKVKPTWVNTLSFLVAVGDENIVQPLLTWIILNDTEILVRFDAGRLTDEQRIDVFKKIFSSYNDKGIWVVSNNFSDQELAAFGYLPQILDFLLQILEDKGQLRIAKLNALHIVDNFDIRDFPEFKDRIRAAFIKLLEAFDSDPVDKYGIQIILGALSRMKINDDDLTKMIVERFSKRQNQHIRSGLYKYLHTSDFVDEYVNVFFDGLEISEIEGAIKDREAINLMDEIFHLKLGLEKIKGHNALGELMKKLGKKNRRIFLSFSDYKEVLVEVVKNLVSSFKENPDIFNQVLQFYKDLVDQYNRDINKLLLPFFEETETKSKALIYWWNADIDKSPYYTSELCGPLVDNDTLRDLINSFSDRDRELQLLRLADVIDWSRYNTTELEAYKKLVKDTATEFNITLVERPVPRDWTELQKQKLQLAFDLLFRRKDLIESVRDIFKVEQKEVIVSEDLYGLRGDIYRNLEDSYILSALDFLRDFTFRGAAVTMKYIDEWSANGDSLLYYTVDKIYDYLHGNNADLLFVSEEQKDMIKKWTQELNLPDAVVWFFLKQFSPILSQDRLLDLTRYFNYSVQAEASDPGIIDELEEYVPKDVLKARVIKNLETGVSELMPWISNASYAIRNGYKEAYPSIFGFLESVTDTEYKLEEVLKLWFKRTKDYARLKAFIENAQSEWLIWKAVKILLVDKKERDFLVKYLTKRMTDSGTLLELRLDAANYLIEIGEMSGFDFIADLIIKEQNPKFDFHRHLRNFKLITNIYAIPKLIKLLSIAKRSEFQLDNFNSLESGLMEAFHLIGIESDENFAQVKQVLENFMTENEGIIPHINFLHVRIRSMEEQLRMQESKTLTVKEALDEFNKLKTAS